MDTYIVRKNLPCLIAKKSCDDSRLVLKGHAPPLWEGHAAILLKNRAPVAISNPTRAFCERSNLKNFNIKRRAMHSYQNELERLLDDLMLFDADECMDEPASRIENAALLAPRRENRTPEKHLIARIKNPTHPAVQKYLEVRKQQADKNRRKSANISNKKKRDDRANYKISLDYEIAQEAGRRLKALIRAVKCRYGDKFLEQLVGREEELTLFWQSMRLAAMQTAGRAPSDQEIATKFSELSSKTYTRHQARARRGIVEKLQQRAGIWLGMS